jgi:SAM-dependent MidA family methyltransferase
MPEVRHIIEVGAGSGILMQQVRAAMGWWGRRGLGWHIVDVSAPLMALQRQRLGSAVQWHDSLAMALASCQGSALIYHNELLDAFAPRLLRWDGLGWQEVFVQRDSQGRWSECLMPAANLDPRLHSALSPQSPWSQGQRVELHEGLHQWLGQSLRTWRQGAMLSIDYGELLPQLYHRRPHGTLRGYRMQQRVEGAELYEWVGRQDLTVDVNFTDYRCWCAQLDLREQSWQNQAEFLRQWDQRPDAAMLDGDGAGGAFKVVAHLRRP